MVKIKVFLSLLISAVFFFLISRPAGQITFRPAAFFSPFEGFWRNAESIKTNNFDEVSGLGLSSPAAVTIDEFRIPHIFAHTKEDMAKIQGYLTAKDRLWQMEFQTHAAAGRISEIVGRGPGDAALKLDKESRRKGIARAAEIASRSMMENPDTKTILQAYSDGVNAYIQSLDSRSLPLEYKLLNYRPEAWSPYKSALLLKYMANTLTSASEDVENSNALKLWGEEMFRLLYPENPFPQAPIIPEGTPFDFKNELFAPEPAKKTFKKYKSSGKSYAQNNLIGLTEMEESENGIGSNNWAVAGSKTASGKPILCNDPHLGFSLPSIWYEIQISCPGVNAYGASLPGAPGVISGFNDSIAWGVTNSERDVFDFYKITYKDAGKNEYQYGTEWKKTEKRVETYKIKGGEIVTDTVIYTHYGPVVYPNTDEGDLALKWTAHDESNDALTFLKLNKARNYRDYAEAISHYQCPGQNFVFASGSGDIAIWQQGKFPNKYKGQGQFILNGADTTHTWKGYIPQEHNPHILNPARGYVGSANQRPTDNTYPYWYAGCRYENFRNRRLFSRLDSMNKITIQDMQNLQLDEYSMYAADVLPVMLTETDSVAATPLQKEMLETLSKWDYYYHKESVGASMFEIWWYYLQKEIWSDDFSQHNVPLVYPNRSATIVLLRDSVRFKFYDNINTPERENRKEVVIKAFKDASDSLARIPASNREWAKVKATFIPHLTRILKPFGKYDIPVGGNNGILNAVGKKWGPSWRMVVSMGEEIEAYTIFPGGESGNPGSPFYDDYIPLWTEGKYHKAWFMKGEEDTKGKVSTKIVFR